MKRMTYKKAGVDIRKAEELVRRISSLTRSTRRKGVLGGIGGFGGLFEVPRRGYQHPVLVAATDSVGTKLKLAGLLARHDTVGIDLVAMNVNDVITTGAEPLFFLDCISTGRIEKKVLVDAVKGIVRGCRQADCTLLGGETAEMPGLYGKGEYDLVGFCVGVVEKKKILHGSTVKAGDFLLGLASSGVHSNGFSLIRKIFSPRELKGKLGGTLLTPTRIYVKPMLALLRATSGDRRPTVKAIAHITGGGFPGNIPRVVPKGLGVRIIPRSWPIPEIFAVIQEKGNIASDEMFRTFNMGVGMVVIIAKGQETRARQILSFFRIKSWVIGEVVKGKNRWR